MIDEELYQQAADELNSDRRRPHIWARACALASDDHDEARYLYTNLRVEELLSEREKGINTASSASNIEDDATLALTPLDGPDSDEQVKGFLDDMEQMLGNDDSIPTSVPAPSGIDLPNTADNSGLDPVNLELDNADTPAGVSGFVDEFIEPDAELMADYIPENHDPLEDTYADDGLGEDDFAKELETFKAEQDQVELTPEISKHADPEPAEHNDFDLDSTTNLNLSADDIAQIQEQVDTDEVMSDPRSDLNSLSEDVGEFVEELDSDLTSGLADSTLVEDLTQANIGVLDAHASELDDMLEEGRFKAAEPEPEPEMGWTEDTFTEETYRDSSPAHEPTIIDADPFTDELSRQADDLDLQETVDEKAARVHQITDDNVDDIFAEQQQTPIQEPEDIVEQVAQTPIEEPAENFVEPTEKPTEQPVDIFDDFVEPASTQVEETTDKGVEVAAAATAAAVVAAAPDLSSAGTQSHAFRDEHESADFPLDLTEGHDGAVFSVYLRDNHAQAVKSGVSWSALFLTLPYLVYRHLYGTALAYIVCWIVAIGGLVLSGLAWMDAGAEVEPLVQACTIGFGLLAFVGLVYLPFRYANSWRSERLENRGFELIALARAKNPGKAIASARRHPALGS